MQSLQTLIKSHSPAFWWAPFRYWKTALSSLRAFFSPRFPDFHWGLWKLPQDQGETRALHALSLPEQPHPAQLSSQHIWMRASHRDSRGRWPFPKAINRKNKATGSVLESKWLQHHPAMNNRWNILCFKDGKCSCMFGREGSSCQTYSGFISLYKQAVNLVTTDSPLGFWHIYS